MSSSARGRDWWALPKDVRKNVDPTAEYVAADAQITDTAGIHMQQFQSPPDRETVREADDPTTRRVIKAINRPRRVGEVEIDRRPNELVSQKTTVGQKPTPDDYLQTFEEEGPAINGFGEMGDDCGDDLAMFCDCCAETTVVGRTCGLSRCPRCWTSWCRDRAISKACRLAVTRAVRDENRSEQQFYHHLAWSPPDDWALQADNPYRKTKQVINEILDAMDLDAVGVYHAFRGEEGEDDRGEWKKRLPNGPEDEWADVRAELEHSPHFHMIAVGSHVPGDELTTRVEEETGWSLHRITKENSVVSLYDNSDMVSALMYAISHAALKRTDAGNNRVKMWQHGDILNQKFVKESETADHEDPYEQGDLVITEETEDEMDLLARAHAPITLGVDVDSQLCTAEFVSSVEAETGAERAGVRSLIDIGTGDTRTWTPVSASSSSDGATGTDTATAELATAGGMQTEVEEIEHNREGGSSIDVCQGRKLPIWEAKSYIGDPEFRESAEHIEQLDATWADWKPRLEAMLDNFG